MMSYGSPSWREWVLDLDASRPLVRRAVEAGITFFDTADMYSVGASEEVTGTLLREFFPRRDDYVLATKVYMPMGEGPNDRGLSRKHVLASIDDSLRRLGTDHVDLYQIHRWDPHTPIEETMEALHDVVRAGQGPLPRRVEHVGLAVRQGPAHRRPGRLDAVRVHAGPLQPDLPRGGAGDAPAVPRPGRGRDPVEPAGPRPAHPAARAGDDDAGGQRPHRRPPLRRVRRRRRARAGRRGEGPRAADGAGRAGVDARQGRGHRADRRGDEAGHIEDAVAAVDVVLSDDEVAALEAAYVPHPVAGHG
jgi:hypothetical protein